ncbi:hypothetical protein GUJ93_ZPchr0012g20180 [Zizania palustris]|uniref:TFIIS central domain-containing protein n=1 Tax=Zizania palustris TaxID=103762 RepID=A0A8J5WPZ0_ZIZPA|nr:hypothetical protein GUJ93_ZPchr0012g20180 [Zizania palustris]
MELSKHGQPPRVAGSAAAVASSPQPLPRAIPQPAQLGYPPVFYTNNWAAQMPVSPYSIVPTSHPPALVGVPSPNAAHLSRARPVSRISLMPLRQVLSVQTALPGMAASQPSPSVLGKKMVASPKVQMLKSVPVRSSSTKRPVQELLPKAHPQLESVRLKFIETLATALNMDSDRQYVHQSSGSVSGILSANENRQADGNALQVLIAVTSQDAGKDDIDGVTKTDSWKSEQDNTVSSTLGLDMTIKGYDDMRQQSVHVPFENEVLDNSHTSDELLQDHGLSWASDIVIRASETISQSDTNRVRAFDIDDGVDVYTIEPEFKRTKTVVGALEEKKGVSVTQKAQILALEIERELYNLFGGVTKKYKEKGRSLLFNLKDKSNPVLRERVLSGDITPKRLSSMTTEELASKELSDWRLAKAEELAKMVVLPNREVDVRRLVRKTHKGEFQVEMEETDGISVEVGIGGDLLSHVQSKPTEGQTKTGDITFVHREDKESDNTQQDVVVGIGNTNMSSNLEYLANGKTDLMPELMVDDMNDTENLPPIMSLDEFMEVLDSEPLFEDTSPKTVQDDPSSVDKTCIVLKSENFPKNEDLSSASESQIDPHAPSQDKCESELESPQNKPGSISSPVEQLKGDLLVKSSPEKVDAGKTDTGNGSIAESITNCQAYPDAVVTHDTIWEGTIKLSLSSASLTNVVAIFKSGEKTSTNEWHQFVDIKGRVRLSAFQEFLEQLPKSRSRAIMVTELRWKEGSLENGRQHLLQTIDSYITDERVGLVKPADGVELYLCPSQGKIAQILVEHLPKEYSSSLTVTETSAIGVVVWRRPHASPRIPTILDDSKRQSISRKQQAMIASTVTLPSKPTKCLGPSTSSSNEHRNHQDVVTDDVPPGFGPGVVRDDDELPEYDFVSIPNAAANATSSQAYGSWQHLQAASRPVDHVREMVRKYGSRTAAAQSWEDDNDDDIPEWDPNQSNLQQTRLPHPPFPPPPPVQQMHTYHHQQQQQQQQQHQYQSMQQHHITQESQSPFAQAYYGQSQQTAMPVQVQQQQPLAHMQSAHAQPGQLAWQANAHQWLAGAAQNVVLTPDSSGQAYYGTGNQAAMSWKPQ